MQRPGRVNLLTLIAVMAMASACGTTPGSTIIKTTSLIEGAAPFENILVVSVAGDVPTRVRFEHEVAAEISGGKTLATAYYTVVGRGPQLTRDILKNVIRARGFDAIVLTRLQGQDRADLVASRPTGRQFNLYLYDYEELNIPASIRTGSTVSFVVEVYDTRTEKKVWGIDSLIFKSKSVESTITEQVAAISAEILQVGLVRR